MNLIKISLILIQFITFYVSIGRSLQCYSCNNTNDCRKPKKFDCNESMANNTRYYLDTYYKDVNMSHWSPYFNCFSESHKSANGENYYKGCIYSTMLGCYYKIRDYFMEGNFERTCNQCDAENACNAASGLEFKFLLMILLYLFF